MDNNKKTEEAAPLPDWMQVQIAMIGGLQEFLGFKDEDSEDRAVSFTLALNKETGAEMYVIQFKGSDCAYLVGRDSLKISTGDTSADLEGGELGSVSEVIAAGVAKYLTDGEPFYFECPDCDDEEATDE